MLGETRCGADPAKLLPIPNRLVVLTFDDGVRSQMTFCVPILERLGFGATFYITDADFVADKTRYLTWADCHELHKAGFEIGNHTRRHHNAAKQSKEVFLAELKHIERRCLDNKIPKPRTFCFPMYLHGPTAVGVLAGEGYQFARRGVFPEVVYDNRGSVGPVYNPREDHPLLIPTTAASGPHCGLEKMLAAVQRATDGNIAVLTFHGVPDLDHPHVHTEPETFRRLMNYLGENDYQVIAVRDLVKYVDPKTGPIDPYVPIKKRTKGRVSPAC